MGKDDIGFNLFSRDNASANINRVNGSLTRLSGTSKRAAADFARMSNTMGRTMQRGGLITIAILGGMVKAYADFDKAMVESLAIMGDVSNEMQKEMAETARIISEETIFSSKSLAEAYYFLASAGMSAEQAVAALGTVAKFAQAGAFDLAQATDLLTDAQTALGLSSKNAEINQKNLVRISDVLVKANTLANASVLQFSEALTNKAAAALVNVNKEMEEGVAVLAAFADKGVKGQVAGQRFTMMLNGMLDASRRNAEVWKKLGVEVWDKSTGEMREFADIIGSMEAALGKMTPKMREATLAQLGFNIKTKDSILTLMGSSSKIREWYAEMKKAKGITDEVSKKQLKALNNQLKLMKNTVVNAAAAIGESLAPVISKLIIKIKEIAKKISAWVKENPKLTATIAKTVLKLAALSIILGTILRISAPVIAFFKFMIPAKLATTLGVTVTKLGGIHILLGKIALAGAAFFAGWKFGEWIGKVTGLNKELQYQMSDTLRFFGLLQKEKAVMTENQKARGEVAESIREIGKELGSASNVLVDNAIAIYKNKEAYNELDPAMKKVVDGFVKHNEKVQASIALEKSYAEEAKKAAERIKADALAQKLADEAAKKAADEKIEAMKVLRKETESYAKALGVLTRQGYAELNKETNMLIGILKKNWDQFQNNETAIKNVYEKIEDLVTIYIHAGKTVPPELEKIREKTEALNNELKFATLPLGRNLYKIMENMPIPNIDEIKNKVVEADVEVKTFKETWADLGSRLQFIDMAFEGIVNVLGKVGVKIGSTIKNIGGFIKGLEIVKKGTSFLEKLPGWIGMATTAASVLMDVFKKLFASHGIEQAIQRENAWMGMNDQLKESLKKLSEEIGNTHAATSMMLADIMKDSDVTVNNFEQWAGRVKEIFIDLQHGYISVEEFQKTMGSSWNQLVSEAQKLSTEGSAKMLEIIREMETKGLKVAEISEYRIAQLKGTAQALQDYTLAGGKNISAYSGALLGALQAEGVGLSEIVEIMGSNLPAGLRKFVDENENVLKGIDASKKMLEGFGNSGYLTQEIFSKLQGDIIRSYDSMTASGENKQQALQAIAPMLAKELWYAQQYNYTLDDKTKKMIEDARAAGINIENMKTEQQLRTEMAHSLKQLVDIMSDFVGATRAGNRELENMAGNARGINFNPGDIPDNRAGGGIPAFGDGGQFWTNKPTVIEVGDRHKPERVTVETEEQVGSTVIGEKHVHLHFDSVTAVDVVKEVDYALRHDGEFRGRVRGN